MYKKIVRTLISILLILSTLASFSAFAVSDELSTSNELSKFTALKSIAEATGTVMTVDSFKGQYAGEVNCITAKKYKDTDGDAKLEIKKIAYNDTIFSLDLSAVITYNSIKKTLVLSGSLYNSWKQENGINSIVGKLTDKTDSFEVLHFEIYNTSKKDIFNSNVTYIGRPHLKVYLQDATGRLLFFELDIPKELSSVEINNTTQVCKDAANDGFWFADFIEPSITEEDGYDTTPYRSTTGFTTSNLGTIITVKPLFFRVSGTATC